MKKYSILKSLLQQKILDILLLGLIIEDESVQIKKTGKKFGRR